MTGTNKLMTPLMGPPSGQTEALRCNVCKRKFLLFGCVQGSGETTCGWRERCVNIKASLGMYGFQGQLTSNCVLIVGLSQYIYRREDWEPVAQSGLGLGRSTYRCQLYQKSSESEKVDVCFSNHAPFLSLSSGKLPLYYRLNCTSVQNCGKVRAPDESHLTYDYTCCNTDFCN
ncbi:uncharacterized protein LOC102943971 [Chelonia mydas]|uniref:uncharacterized protein LOC102943971 n=1 Tax=Chelonia mydas TaxID=8469 RepID=UPI001CA92D76|nr:uncharacterized protein LOC102943971 [Chelonia mydas]